MASKKDSEIDPKRREELERAIRHRVGCEEKAFRIVERLLDNPIEDDFLIDCARFINPGHYTDVVEERAIVKQCGYPVCNNLLTSVPKQKYHISMKTNKVYDISDRKNFCSAFCYKASKYYLSQLSDTPIWTRENDRPPDVKLLPRDLETTSKTSLLVAQDEVISFGIQSQAVDDAGAGESSLSEKEVMDMVSDDLSTLTFGESVKKERLEQLAKIAAAVDSQKRVKVEDGKRDQDSKMPPDMKEVDLKNEQRSKKGQGDESQVEEIISESTNKQTISHSVSQNVSGSEMSVKSKQTEVMKSGIQDNEPAPTATQINKPAATATQDNKPPATASAVKQKKSKTKSKKAAKQIISPLQLIEKTLLEWRTESTLKFLKGEEEEDRKDTSSSVVKDNKTSGGIVAPSPRKLEARQEKRAEKSEELDSDDDPDEEPPGAPSKPIPDMENLRKETEEFSLKVEEFYHGKQVKRKEEKQRGSDEVVKDVQKDVRERGVFLPPVDSKSQMVIRRRITIDRLNRTLPDVLLPMQLSLRDINSDLHHLMRTFSLSSHNITFKPNIWILVGIVLLHMLAVRNASLASSLKQYHQFLSNLLSSVGTSVEEIAHFVTRYHQSENM